MFDAHGDPLADTHREVGGRSADGQVDRLLIRRHYDAPVEDVWEACTTPDRLARFFVRPEGDLRPGGTFRIEGNASGEILRCEPPRLLRVTWVYGEPTGDEVELRISPGDGGGSVLELQHSSPSGVGGRLLNDPETGLWGLGTGWELGFVGLAAFLRGDFTEEPPPAAEVEKAVAELADRCGRAWAEALAESGPTR